MVKRHHLLFKIIEDQQIKYLIQFGHYKRTDIQIYLLYIYSYSENRNPNKNYRVFFFCLPDNKLH